MGLRPDRYALFLRQSRDPLPITPHSRTPFAPTINVAATLLQFSVANDAAAQTTKKLVKQKVLAEYFRTLDDEDLRLAVRYCAGRDFPSTDERTTNVGGAIFSDVAMDVLQLDGATWHDLVVRSGEIGEALSRARSAGSASGSPAAPPRVSSSPRPRRNAPPTQARRTPAPPARSD